LGFLFSQVDILRKIMGVQHAEPLRTIEQSFLKKLDNSFCYVKVILSEIYLSYAIECQSHRQYARE